MRFKGFEGEWESKKVEDIGEVITGSTPPTSNSSFYNGNFLFVSPFDIQINRYVIQTNTTLTEKGFKIGRKVRKGSSLFVCIGSTIGKVGQAGVDCVTNQQINSVIPNDNNNDNFIYSLLEFNSSKIRTLSAEQAVPIINKTTFSKVKIQVPLLPEQCKIASFLSLIDERIATQMKTIEEWEKNIRGLYSLIFSDTNKLFFTKKLVEICDIIKGEQINNSELLSDGDYYVMNGGISPSGYHSDFNSEADTISISEGGNSCGYVQYNSKKFWSGGHCYTLKNIDRSIDKKYLYHYLKFSETKIMRLRVGSGLPNIQKKSLEMFDIRLLNINEQILMAKIFDCFEEKINLEKSFLSAYQQQKKYLLQNLFI